MRTNQVEDGLGRYVDELSASVDPISAGEAMERRRSTARGRWAAGALAAAVVLVALALVGVAVLGGDDETQVATAPVTDEASDAPPAAELAPLSDDVELWLSATEVPPGDHEVVAALVARREFGAVFGLGAQVEQWDGEGWRMIGHLAPCPDPLVCTSRVAEPGDGGLAFPDLGLLAAPGSPGPMERFTIAGLADGWYRISKAGDGANIASGILRIAPAASQPAPLPPTDAPAIGLRPPIFGSEGGPAALEPLIPSGPDGQSLEDVEAAVAGLAEEVLLQRWDGQLWATITVLPLRPDDDGRRVERSMDIPRLEPGAYRLVREGPDDPHTGNLWVVDGVLPDAAVEEVPRDHEIRLDEPPLVVGVELPAGLRERPNPRDPGTGPVYVESWLDPATGGSVGVSIQPDPGDDAPLFQLPVLGRIESPLGSWTVHQVGEDRWATTMAMLRHDGLLFQVTGGRAGDREVVRAMAMSLEVERLQP